MPGAWLLTIGLAGPTGWDTATFELSIDIPATGQDDLDPERLRSLWIQSLGVPESDPSNRVADNPRARELGHLLFFEKGISANGEVACASCHQVHRPRDRVFRYNADTLFLPIGSRGIRWGTIPRHVPGGTR